MSTKLTGEKVFFAFSVSFSETFKEAAFATCWCLKSSSQSQRKTIRDIYQNLNFLFEKLSLTAPELSVSAHLRTEKSATRWRSYGITTALSKYSRLSF